MHKRHNFNLAKVTGPQHCNHCNTASGLLYMSKTVGGGLHIPWTPPEFWQEKIHQKGFLQGKVFASSSSPCFLSLISLAHESTHNYQGGWWLSLETMWLNSWPQTDRQGTGLRPDTGQHRLQLSDISLLLATHTHTHTHTHSAEIWKTNDKPEGSCWKIALWNRVVEIILSV